MLREWRALRVAQGDNSAPVVLAGSPDSIVRIRVGEKVQQTALISGSEPDYPEEARAKGIEGVVFYLAIYMVMTLGVFAVILLMKRRGVMVEGIPDLAGLARSQPGMALALLIFMFSFAGIPPLGTG